MFRFFKIQLTASIVEAQHPWLSIIAHSASLVELMYAFLDKASIRGCSFESSHALCCLTTYIGIQVKKVGNLELALGNFPGHYCLKTYISIYMDLLYVDLLGISCYISDQVTGASTFKGSWGSKFDLKCIGEH